MTLLQTRVDESTARKFTAVARKSGKTPYSLLQDLVTDTANQHEPEGWEVHRERIAAIENKALPFNTVAQNRVEAGER